MSICHIISDVNIDQFIKVAIFYFLIIIFLLKRKLTFLIFSKFYFLLAGFIILQKSNIWISCLSVTVCYLECNLFLKPYTTNIMFNKLSER